jgi:steroid delta-isomerase-like uncharacterized protein
MATLDNGALLRGMYKAFDAKDMDRVLSYSHPDARVTNMAFGATMSIRDYETNWANAFPDSKVEVVTLVAQGDIVIAEFVGRGTHTGALVGPAGTLPPTHRPLDMRFVEIWQFRNGKIAAGRMYFDSATFYRQLGITVPAEAATARPAVSTAPATH